MFTINKNEHSQRKHPLSDFEKHTMDYLRIRLKEEILKRYKSVEEFAEKNILNSRTIYSYFSKSPRIPSITKVAELAYLLDTSIDKLVGNDEAFEISNFYNVSIEVYLKNLYRIIHECGLEIHMIKNQTILVSKNEYLQQFLRQMAMSGSNINEVVEKFSDLKVYNGQIYSKKNYDYLTSEEYQDMQKLYSDISDDEFWTTPEELEEYKKIRNAEIKNEKLSGEE